MEERIARLGGTLNVDSEPGRGTIVSFELPLPDAVDGRSADEAFANRIQNQFRQIVNVQFLEDVVAVRLDGGHADVQCVGRDLLVAFPDNSNCRISFSRRCQQIVAIFDSAPRISETYSSTRIRVIAGLK